MAMNRGVLESSPVQHLTVAGNPNWWNNVNGGLRTSPPLMSQQPPPTSSSSSSSPSLLPPPNYSSNPNFSSWLANSDLPLDQPWSLSQLLLSGLMMGEEERMEMMYNIHHHSQAEHSDQKHKQENWEEEVLRSMKQETDNSNGYVIKPLPNSPPNKSCVTIHNNINEDDNKNIHNHNGLNLTECNRSEIIGESSLANKKPKLEVSSSQSSDLIKVKKEKLRGRIASLHQIVSPFGKTDTASVLSEAIGYIRFLHSQIEALSVPYFGTPPTNNMMHQHASQGYKNDIFPEDTGQLMNEDGNMIRSKGSSLSTTNNQESEPNKEANEDLRSKGLCLVPVSSTLQDGSNNNGADYWAPTFGFAFQ